MRIGTWTFVFLILGCICMGVTPENSQDEIIDIRLPYGPPGKINVGEENAIYFTFGEDSLLVSMEGPEAGYREIHQYHGVVARTFLGVPPQIQEYLGPVRHLNSYRCMIKNQVKAWGVGEVNFGMRLNNYAVEARNLTTEEFVVVRSLKMLPIIVLPPDEMIVSISLQYAETDYRDAEFSMFYRIELTGDQYEINTSRPIVDPQHNEEPDSLMIGRNIPIPDYWYIPVDSDSDSLYAESSYWSCPPSWWGPTYSSNDGQTDNTLLWVSLEDSWSYGVYRHYDYSNHVLFIWEWRRQWIGKP